MGRGGLALSRGLPVPGLALVVDSGSGVLAEVGGLGWAVAILPLPSSSPPAALAVFSAALAFFLLFSSLCRRSLASLRASAPLRLLGYPRARFLQDPRGTAP